MPTTFEREGIIFFTTPYHVRFSDWIGDHLDCDSIIERDTAFDDMISVLCYSGSKENNALLRDVQRREYVNDLVLRGIDSREVSVID